MVKNILDQKIIGVVGGVGPYAGLDLVKKIFDQTEAKRDQEHLPVAMLSLSPRVADRTAFLLGETKQNPAYAIADIILELEKIGAAIVGIPCNTAHARQIWDKIQDRFEEENSSVTLLHMIEEVEKFIRNEHSTIKKVGVLSTTGTHRTRIYPNILEEKGLQVILPDETLQDKIHNAIYNPGYGIKSYSNPVTEKSKDELLSSISELRNDGAEAIILGCTELPLAITEQIIEDCLVIDPTLILARALIHASNPDKLKPLEVKQS